MEAGGRWVLWGSYSFLAARSLSVLGASHARARLPRGHSLLSLVGCLLSQGGSLLRCLLGRSGLFVLSSVNRKPFPDFLWHLHPETQHRGGRERGEATPDLGSVLILLCGELCGGIILFSVCFEGSLPSAW